MCKLLQLLLVVLLGQFTVSAAERTKGAVSITTTPKFEERGQFTYLIIGDAKHSYDVAWAMPPGLSFVPVSIETNRVYTFTVVEEPYKSIKITKLTRVQQQGKIIYDVEVCEVHKTRMEHKKVRIAYGLIMPSPGQPTADDERELFPHWREISFGGCCIEPDSPKAEKIYVCSQCKVAHEKWTKNRQNPKK
jgi:hypothetical protein